MTTALKLDHSFPVLMPVPSSTIDARALEIVDLLGWNDLPDRLIELIESDLIGFHDELSGMFCTNCEGVRNRRRTVDYWIQNYLNGISCYDTTYKMLKVGE